MARPTFGRPARGFARVPAIRENWALGAGLADGCGLG
jgi:hypothetical protein